MAFIITPGQFTQRAEFYHQLQQLTSAGVGLVRALEMLRRSPPARSYRAPIGQILEAVAQGYSFSEALNKCNRWLPEFDKALLRAGEQSGRLDACFHLLAKYYTDRARIARQIIADLLYPLFLWHFAVLIFAFVRFVRSESIWYIVVIGLAPVYVIPAVLIYAGQNKHGEAWRAWVESLLRPIPVLGTSRHFLALSRLAASLEALISAGVTVVEAWEMAAQACGSPALRRSVLAWRPFLNAGQTPSEIIQTDSYFPELFANQYTTGEVSGKLDENLTRLHNYYQEEGSRKLHLFSQWVPRFIYLCIMLICAYMIVQFYTGYFQQVRDAGGF